MKGFDGKGKMKIKIVSKNGKHFAHVPFEYSPGYVFTEDEKCEDYDWLVVFDDLKDDVACSCGKERTILATWEPVSIKNYCKAFTEQFGHLLTNRPPEAEGHPGYHCGIGYFPWYNCRTYSENKAFVIPKKTKLISAVCSSKAMRWTAHYDRIRLMRTLESEIPGMDWFGWGVKELKNKNDALDEYRYHVAFENHIASHYWTEKLADAFLCECLPFYVGDSKLEETFPAESFIRIPHDDPGAAVEIIKRAIANDEWSKRIGAVREAKRLLFEKYNFYAQVIGLIEAAGDVACSGSCILHSRKAVRATSWSAKMEDGMFHLKQYLSGVGLWKKTF